jgi:hypothetical protein
MNSLARMKVVLMGTAGSLEKNSASTKTARRDRFLSVPFGSTSSSAVATFFPSIFSSSAVMLPTSASVTPKYCCMNARSRGESDRRIKEIALRNVFLSEYETNVWTLLVVVELPMVSSKARRFFS